MKVFGRKAREILRGGYQSVIVTPFFLNKALTLDVVMKENVSYYADSQFDEVPVVL